MYLTNHSKKISENKGYTVILVLVFAGVFLTITSSLTGFIFVQKKLQFAKENSEKAIQTAEAGLDYYKWFLAHFPDDLQDGTGGAGPYVHNYSDPEGGEIGKFSLDISGSEQCGVTQSVEIISTGWSNNNVSIKRTISGKYARPSIAEFAFILNSNVWAGSDRVINGPYHSNGGIRMDGTNNSTVTSGVSDWLCTSSFGCSPNTTQDGVFGGGSGFDLWNFPSPPVDFVGITVDLVNMKALAQANGIYFNPFGGNPEQKGYHFIFKSDGTFDAYRVTKTNYVWGFHTDDRQWHRDYHVIKTENFIDNFTIPSDCSLIFSSANLWIEGVIDNKTTIVAANVSNPNIDSNIVLNGNITYTAQDGTKGLTAIADNSVLIPLLSPDDMELNGIFLAQNGYFGRNYYTNSGSRRVPGQYSSFVKQNSLTTKGTIVSNGRVGTRWSCSGNYCSGYENRTNSYDRKLATSPPPMTPSVSTSFRFVEWLEVE